MASVVKTSDNTFTITLNTDEQIVCDWCYQQYGELVLNDLITNWLKDRSRIKEESQRDNAYAAFLKMSEDEKVSLLNRVNKL